MAHLADILAEDAWEKVLENGGFSFGNPVEDNGVHYPAVPSDGYMVGGMEAEIVVPSDEGLVKAATAYMARRYQTMVEGGNAFIGGWVNEDTGMVHIDVSQRMNIRTRAIEAAKARGEIAIWDVANSVEVRV